MKKILMSTAAIAGLAFVVAAPARADEPALQLGLGGYISSYAVYTDQDEAAGVELRNFDLRKDTEVHLNGEVALDNGITAGAHMELLNDRFDDGTTEESYLYLSSSWGRINMGEEDGIAYLLQVGAPSADDKIDGIRPDIGTFTAANGGTLDYAHDDFGYTNKLTYITPVFNGFQAGVSYTPSPSEGDLDALAASAVANTVGADLENAWEVAARYEGSFDAIDLALGAGYSHASQEVEAATEDDLETWNVGANIGWGAFGLGAAYLTTNNATGGTAADNDSDTWVAGADYTTGPYKLGLSYLNMQNENAANDTEVDRWTAGVIYEWGPGMTFRGAVQWQDAENIGGVATADGDGTQVTLGTQLEF
jgi:predicted porin